MQYNKTITGYIHSVYHGGMVDGPGIRSVIFLSGCPLRCLYCHNPDTWEKTNGDLLTVEHIVNEVLKYSSFHKATGGGVTISGGDPFAQFEFLLELLKACKAHGIHTAIDTSGYTGRDKAREALQFTDLLMLDIKSYNFETYEKITGVSIDRTLRMLDISRELNVPTWVRYVLVPGLTDNMDELKGLANFLRGYPNVEKIEVLPFHKAGEYKWKEHDIPYELEDTPPPTKEMLDAAKEIFVDWTVS